MRLYFAVPVESGSSTDPGDWTLTHAGGDEWLPEEVIVNADGLTLDIAWLDGDGDPVEPSAGDVLDCNSYGDYYAPAPLHPTHLIVA